MIYIPDYLERVVRVALDLPKDIIMRSVDIDQDGRFWMTNDGRLLSVCREQPRFKQFRDNGNGYYQTVINGKYYYLHRLLAISFNENKEKAEIIKNGGEVHHIDFNRDNNNLGNLCIVSKEKHQAIHSIWNKLKKWRVIPWEDLQKPCQISE